jgi:hypothetical protein
MTTSSPRSYKSNSCRSSSKGPPRPPSYS